MESYRHPTQIPRSGSLRFDWAGERVISVTENVKGDTYPQTWAADGEIYAGSGDSSYYVRDGVNVIPSGWLETEEIYHRVSGLTVEKFSGEPDRFETWRVNDMTGYIGGGGSGPKPSGMIGVGGKLYMAVHNTLGWKPPRYGENSQHSSDATIIESGDFGATWSPELDAIFLEFEKKYNVRDPEMRNSWKTPPETRTSIGEWTPMFGGCLFGGPSFVQFGMDNTDAIDEYVYAVSSDQWDNGGELRLGRVRNDRIADRSAWEFMRGGKWVKGLEDSEPILKMPGHIGLPEMIYIKAIKKFLLLTWALHEDFKTETGSELTILESDDLAGPFRLVHYEWMWHNTDICAYGPRVPMKWLNQSKLEGHMLYSGNWKTFFHYYKPHMQKFRLTMIGGE